MAYIPDDVLQGMTPSISIDDYQVNFRLPVGAFYNVNNPAEVRSSCRSFWTQSNREELARYLAIAEDRRELELGYHIGRKGIVEERQNVNSGFSAVLHKKHFYAGGSYTTSVVESSAALTLKSGSTIVDPVVLTVSTSVTDSSEIVVYHEGTTYEIKPSSVSISGGVATIKIPRARLVDISYLDDREDPLDYETDSYFVTAVDVYRKYIGTDHGHLEWSPVQRAILSDGYPSQNVYTQNLYLYAKAERSKIISHVNYTPTSYVNSIYTGVALAYNLLPETALLNYISGVPNTSQQITYTSRLAHTLMPNPPCGCSEIDMIWQNDRQVMDRLTPYGATSGALEVWLHDSRRRVGLGGAL